jgi:hypothetical protein
MFHWIQMEAAIRCREQEIRKAMQQRQVREAMALCNTDANRPACLDRPAGLRNWTARFRRGRVKLAR